MIKALKYGFIGMVLFFFIATSPGKINAASAWIFQTASNLGAKVEKSAPKRPNQRGSATQAGKLDAKKLTPAEKRAAAKKRAQKSKSQTPKG